MRGLFQKNLFQNNLFQTDVTPSDIGGRSGGGGGAILGVSKHRHHRVNYPNYKKIYLDKESIRSKEALGFDKRKIGSKEAPEPEKTIASSGQDFTSGNTPIKDNALISLVGNPANYELSENKKRDLAKIFNVSNITDNYEDPEDDIIALLMLCSY